VRKLKSFAVAALAGCASIASSATVIAQDYPSQPLVWIAPSSPGSGFDVVARIIAPKLSEVLGQSVIVENITGAGGTIGAARAAEADPDGYTVLMVNINHTSAEALRNDLPYNLLESFEPVIRFAASYYVYVVHPDVEATTLEEFIALAKERPDDFNVANAGIGSATFMSGEYFKSKAGLDIQHIPYEGGGPALASIVAGETQFYGAPLATAKPFIDDGGVRPNVILSCRICRQWGSSSRASSSRPGMDLSFPRALRRSFVTS
jgi:tripartite-type tricarboxylate transporter receptor subunit TctC